MPFLDDLATVPQREKGGSVAQERFDFQTCWGVSKIFKLHQTNNDYALAFEFHDDIVVLDSATNPKSAKFYQVKTDEKNKWTLGRIVGAKKTGKTVKASYMAKMLDNALRFGSNTNGLFFVSNQEANFVTNGSNPFPFNQLSKEDYATFKKKIVAENPKFTDMHGNLFHFEKADISLESFEEAALGKTVDFIIAHTKLIDCNYKSFFLAVGEVCRRRARNIDEVADFSALLDAKFITRSDVTGWLSDLEYQTIRRPSWDAIHPQLEHLSFAEKVMLKKEWRNYEVQKASSTSLSSLEIGRIATGWIDDFAATMSSLEELLENGAAYLSKHKRLEPLSFNKTFLEAVVLYEFYST